METVCFPQWFVLVSVRLVSPKWPRTDEIQVTRGAFVFTCPFSYVCEDVYSGVV